MSPVITLNNFSTPDQYTDSSTVIFSYPKRGFAMNIVNAQIFYQLAIPGASGQAGDYTWDGVEHILLPSMTNFQDPASEGFPGASGFSGVRVRSAAAGVPAVVTVI